MSCFPLASPQSPTNPPAPRPTVYLASSPGHSPTPSHLCGSQKQTMKSNKSGHCQEPDGLFANRRSKGVTRKHKLRGGKGSKQKHLRPLKKAGEPVQIGSGVMWFSGTRALSELCVMIASPASEVQAPWGRNMAAPSSLKRKRLPWLVQKDQSGQTPGLLALGS